MFTGRDAAFAERTPAQAPGGASDAAGAAVVCVRDAVRCSQTEAESPRDAVGPRGHQRLPPSLPPPLLAASSSLPETGSRGERSYEISTDVSHTGRRGWAGRVAAARVSDEPSANGPARSHLTRGPSRDEGAQGGHAPERPVQPPPGPPRPAPGCQVSRAARLRWTPGRAGGALLRPAAGPRL